MRPVRHLFLALLMAGATLSKTSSADSTLPHLDSVPCDPRS